MSYKLSNNSFKNIAGVNPILIAIIVEALIDKDCPYDFGIPQFGGIRNAREQNALYHAGLSQLNGYTKKSKHQSGNAVDIFVYVDGRATWDIKYYKPLARHIMMIASTRYGIQLTWGGDWHSFPDYVHFQID